MGQTTPYKRGYEMNLNGKKIKEEWAFFISPLSQKLSYNKKCKNCIHDCEQTFHAKIVRCPYYEIKEDCIC